MRHFTNLRKIQIYKYPLNTNIYKRVPCLFYKSTYIYNFLYACTQIYTFRKHNFFFLMRNSNDLIILYEYLEIGLS